jgi:hypothetical protein
MAAPNKQPARNRRTQNPSKCESPHVITARAGRCNARSGRREHPAVRSDLRSAGATHWEKASAASFIRGLQELARRGCAEFSSVAICVDRRLSQSLAVAVRLEPAAGRTTVSIETAERRTDREAHGLTVQGQ